MRFTKGFSRVVSTSGSVDTRFLFSLMTLIGRAIVSLEACVAALTFVALTSGGSVVFFVLVFTIGFGFFAVVVFVLAIAGGAVFGGITLIHSRKLISSTAKSFPHPPGAESAITRIKDALARGV